MKNRQRKSKKSKSLVPVQPEEYKYEVDDEFLRASACLMEDSVTLQTVSLEHTSLGLDQVRLIRLFGLCLERVSEESAPKEWLDKVKEKVSQISKLLNTYFDPEGIKMCFDLKRKMETFVQEAEERDEEQEVLELRYKFLRFMQDNYSFFMDEVEKGPSDFNQINQWICELHEQLKGQDLEKMFGAALRILETSFVKLQANGETIERQSFTIVQCYGQMCSNMKTVSEGLAKIHWEKFGIEMDMSSMAIADLEKNGFMMIKDKDTEKEEDKDSNQSDSDLAQSQSHSSVEDSKEEVKVEEKEEEAPKQNEESEDLENSPNLDNNE